MNKGKHNRSRDYIIFYVADSLKAIRKRLKTVPPYYQDNQGNQKQIRFTAGVHPVWKKLDKQPDWRPGAMHQREVVTYKARLFFQEDRENPFGVQLVLIPAAAHLTWVKLAVFTEDSLITVWMIALVMLFLPLCLLIIAFAVLMRNITLLLCVPALLMIITVAHYPAYRLEQQRKKAVCKMLTDYLGFDPDGDKHHHFEPTATDIEEA